MLHSRELGAGPRVPSRLLAVLLSAATAGLFAALPAYATTINVPSNQPTIQAGINAAAAFGDEVVVADGTYTGAGNRDISLTKHITVRSASRNPATCIIDCQTAGRGFLVSGVTNVARIEGFTIKNALTDEGGGIKCDNASPTIVNCRLLANKANVTGGGGLACVNGSAPRLTGCVLNGNTTNGYDGGAGVYNVGGQPTLINCTLSGNTTTGLGVIGGALRNKSAGQVTFTNCTFSGNNAYDATAMYSDGTGTQTTLVNCIVWGHGPGTSGVRIQSAANAVTTITYTDVQQGFAGTGNINVNPGFIDANGADNVIGNADDDVRLGRFSPATDAGNNAAAGLSGITTDQGGSPRKFDDTNVPNTGSGTAPIVDMGAFERQAASVSVTIHVPGDAATIQAGIDLAQLKDEVVIADGTYAGAGNVELLIDKDITVRSASGNPSACLIDGGAAARGVNFSGATNAAVLKGIGITNGRKTEGAGLYFSESAGTILNCRISGNVAIGQGGGGAYLEKTSSPQFWNTIFLSNSTSGVGVVGGALYIKGASLPTFRNCLFTSNSGYDATVLYQDGAGTVSTFVNTIIYGNTGGTSGQRLQSVNGATLSATYCDVEGGLAGTGNFNSNPIFADGEYRLAPISPCVDTGSNAGVPIALAQDRDGKLRIWDGNGDTHSVVDLGPFEFGAPQVTGISEVPLPAGFRLLAASPNPTPSRSRIHFTVPTAGWTSLVLYDVSGRRVRTLIEAVLAEGEQDILWDGRDDAGHPVAAGLYFMRLGWNRYADTGKILVVR
jgi:parallel beta helix pectate lyase-like protein/flagellar hook capping protein FlgD